MRPLEEEAAVEFVFKYGLALTAMGLLDAMKRTPEWKTEEATCRQRIEASGWHRTRYRSALFVVTQEVAEAGLRLIRKLVEEYCLAGRALLTAF